MATIKLPFYVRLAFILLALVLIYTVLHLAASLFIPLTFGLLVAILLNPLNRWFENKLHVGRAGAAIICVILFVSVFVGFIYFLTLQIVSFSRDLPMLRKRFQDMFSSIQQWLTYKLHITSSQQAGYTSKYIDNFIGTATHYASNIFISIFDILLLIILVLIFTFFMLYHRRLLMKFVVLLFGAADREKVSATISDTKRMIYAYVLGLAIEMAILSVVICAMFLIMGIKYALLLGVMAAVLNVIPYLGIYSSIAITILITLANSSGRLALEAGIGLLIVHMLDANILFPRIVGGSMKLNPFITILSVIVGEFLWGVPGMFLLIPITGIMKLTFAKIDGMEAWALLIGEEESLNPKPKIKLNKE